MNFFDYEPKRKDYPSRPLNAHGNRVLEDAQTRWRLGLQKDLSTTVPAEPKSSRKGVLALLSALLNLGRF